MKTEDAAWLAAALDGEGSLTWNWQELPNGPRAYPELRVYNTVKEFVEKAARVMETRTAIYENHSPERHGGRTVYAAACTRREEVGRLLQAVLPYLIIKRERAVEILSWLRGNPVIRGRPIPQIEAGLVEAGGLARALGLPGLGPPEDEEETEEK
ncbi:MAG: hypothetical protein V3U45_07655 [bacterium]